MSRTVLVTGASSGFGAMITRELAGAGDVVYAGMRDTTGRNAPAVADLAGWAGEHGAARRRTRSSWTSPRRPPSTRRSTASSPSADGSTSSCTTPGT